VLEKVALELAGSFSVERIAEQVRASWAHKPSLEEVLHRVRTVSEEWGHAAGEELAARTRRAREEAHARIASLSLPHLPTLEELRGRAEEMFQNSHSLELVAARAREMLQDAVSRALLEPALAHAR
jgi:stearoyl-CoA desaturase (delta-9 desaturase)